MAGYSVVKSENVIPPTYAVMYTAEGMRGFYLRGGFPSADAAWRAIPDRTKPPGEEPNVGFFRDDFAGRTPDALRLLAGGTAKRRVQFGFMTDELPALFAHLVASFDNDDPDRPYPARIVFSMPQDDGEAWFHVEGEGAGAVERSIVVWQESLAGPDGGDGDGGDDGG